MYPHGTCLAFWKNLRNFFPGKFVVMGSKYYGWNVFLSLLAFVVFDTITAVVGVVGGGGGGVFSTQSSCPRMTWLFRCGFLASLRASLRLCHARRRKTYSSKPRFMFRVAGLGEEEDSAVFFAQRKTWRLMHSSARSTYCVYLYCTKYEYTCVRLQHY